MSGGRDQFKQVAEETPFDNETNDFVADDVQAAIEEIKDLIDDFQGAFELLEEDGLDTTTSNSWVTMDGWPQTSALKTAGGYTIDYTANVGQSDKEKGVGSRVQYRIGATGSWILLEGSDIRNGISEDDQYELRTSFQNIRLVSDDVIQFRWQFGQTDNGGTGRIRNSAIRISKVQA